MTDIKHVIAVIGMARSGTSAITRGLQALGIDLGDKLTPGNNRWNQRGFWEDNDVVYKVNRRVAATLGFTWTGIHLMDEQCRNNPALNELKKVASDLLKERMAQVNYWGFKDPRTARMLPFWQEVFKELNLQDEYIIALRNPLSSATSWQKLSGMDLELGMLLWTMHLVPAIEQTRHKKRVLVSYDLMLQNPRFQLERIQKALQLVVPSEEAISHYTNDFLDKKLQHHEFTLTDLKNHPASGVAPLSVKIYELLMQVARDELSLDSIEFVVAWEEIRNEFNKLLPIYTYLDSLLNQHKELERTVRTIKKSFPWKLIYPIRWVDDKLRGRRKKQKALKKFAYE